jgi:hypothetical protein
MVKTTKQRGIPQNGWFVIDPMKMDELGVPTVCYCRKPPNMWQHIHLKTKHILSKFRSSHIQFIQLEIG